MQSEYKESSHANCLRACFCRCICISLHYVGLRAQLTVWFVSFKLGCYKLQIHMIKFYSTLVTLGCIRSSKRTKWTQFGVTAWGFLSKSLHILYFPPSWDPRLTILVQYCHRCVSWCSCLESVSSLNQWNCSWSANPQSVHVQGSSDCFLSDCSSTLDEVDRQFLSRCSLDTSLSLVFSPEWNLSPLSGCSALCGSLWIFPRHHSLQFFTLFFQA